MTPALASESDATRIVACGGMVTRTAPPAPRPHAATPVTAASSTKAAFRRIRQAITGRSLVADRTLDSLCALPLLNRWRSLQRVLQEHRGRQRIHVAFTTLGRAAHL